MSTEIHLWRTLVGIPIATVVLRVPPLFALPLIITYWIGIMIYRRREKQNGT